MTADIQGEAPRGDAAPPRGRPTGARSKWSRRYWGFIYLQRRLMFLALMVWAAITCAIQLSGPRWEAAAVGALCAGIVLYVQGGWVWRRYRRWFR